MEHYFNVINDLGKINIYIAISSLILGIINRGANDYDLIHNFCIYLLLTVLLVSALMLCIKNNSLLREIFSELKLESLSKGLCFYLGKTPSSTLKFVLEFQKDVSEQVVEDLYREMFIEFSKHAGTGQAHPIYGNFSKEVNVTIDSFNGNVKSSSYWTYNICGESQEEITKKFVERVPTMNLSLEL